MRKRKGKFSNFFMLSLLLILFYFVFTEIRSLEISAEELARNYGKDVRSADEKFLEKEIELLGKVKAYFEFDDNNDLLELVSESATISVFCILIDEEQIKTAKNLTQGTNIKINGKCLGFAENIFPNSIYIRVNKIK